MKGVVSFHGSLRPPELDQVKQVKAKLLICHGSADPFTKAETVQNYIASMNASDLDLQMIMYGGAKHSFTNPNADKADMAALKYGMSADQRSWSHMKQFFDEIF